MQLDIFSATARPTDGTTTVHAIGRCTVKGCKQRKRNTYPGRISTDQYGTRTHWSIPTKYGPESPFSRWDGETPTVARLMMYAQTDRTVIGYVLAMRGAGWVCPDHDPG